MDGEWKADGPALPIEFARQSNDGRVTRVIVPSARHLVSTAWCYLKYSTLDEAREELRVREGNTRQSWIGSWPGGSPQLDAVNVWAEEKDLEGVVWTSIPPKWDGTDDVVPTSEEVLTYLSTLDGEARRLAEQYIRKAPDFVRTPYRDLIEERLGWRRVIEEGVPPAHTR